MDVRVSIEGDDLRKLLQDEGVFAVLAAEKGLEAAAKTIQTQLRANVAAAGFAGGGTNLVNAWRMKIFRDATSSTALIYTRTPEIIDRFDSSQTVTAKSGRYLAWPTAINLQRGHREGGIANARVSTADMMAAKHETAVIRTKKPGLALWCLKVRAANGRSLKTGRANKTRIRLFVGGKNVEILTGKLKAGVRQQKVQALLDKGYAAMFFLEKQITTTKRLNVAGIFATAGDQLEASIIAAMA